MPKKRALDDQIEVRLKCASYLFRAGSLDPARKLANREGFARNSGPWITAISLLMEWEMKNEERGYLLVCKDDLHPIVEVARDDLGCIGCFKHKLKLEDTRRIDR